MKTILYHILWLILLLLSPLLLLVRAKKSSAYLARWNERYALRLPNITNGSILIHAVSVGENIAAQALIKALLQQYPDKKILITCTTCTGSDWIKKHWKNELNDQIEHAYLPYDAPWLMARFFNALQPSQVIIMETEVWPALIQQCHKRQIPLLLANARMSEKSFMGYQNAAKYLPMNWHNITHIIAQAPADADRFKALGANNVSISASLKFEPSPLPELNRYFKALNAHVIQAQNPRLNKQKLVWIAASTHQGEDEVILNAHKQLLETTPEALLLLVPRHPERFEKVFSLCQQYFPQRCQRRSSEQAIESHTNILLIDSIGEMMQAFQLSQKAFIGGSLVNEFFKGTGGHNPIEPLIAGNQISMGSSRFNFASICQQLDEQQLLTHSNNAENLAVWLTHPIPEDYQSTTAKWLETQKGALAIHLQIIDKLMTSLEF
jgi:3-deoxy-D-manno-octulosonic-acid transferase